MSKSAKKISVEECDRILTNDPRLPFAVEETTFNGNKYKVWKNVPKTWREFILSSLEKWSHRSMLSSESVAPNAGPDDRDEYTFGQVRDRAIKFAAWLKSKGVRIGSPVGIIGQNSVEWVVAFLAIEILGAVPVFVNATLHHDHLVHCLKITAPVISVCDAQTAKTLGPLVGQLPRNIGPLYTWDSLDSPVRGVTQIGKIEPPEGLVREVLNNDEFKTLGPDSNATIFFTSGTTSRPKAVLSTQRQSLHNVVSGIYGPARAAVRAGADPLVAITPKPEQSVVLFAIPFFHVTGLEGWVVKTLQSGFKLVMMGKWNSKKAVDLCVKEKVTILGGVPSVVTSIIQSPHLPEDHIFTGMSYGGAPPPERLAGDLYQRWPTASLYHGYGMTELNAVAINVAGYDYVQRPTAVGHAVPICELKIVDPDTKKELPTGETGLILVRGSNVMVGYLGDEEATRNTLSADGWLDTGDCGFVDDEGFLFIQDRLKDVIIRGGENVASAEVENAIYQDARIAECAAVPVPDPKLSELVAVAVSLAPNARATPESIMKEVEGRLRYHARPVFVLVSDEPLDRNANGKLIKMEIKKKVRAAYAAWKEGQARGVRAKL